MSEATTTTTENGSKWFDLKPNRDLLDNTFDGYKLSLDKLAQYKYTLNELNKQPVDSICSHNDSQTVTSSTTPYFYQHIKLFGFFNHLFNNQFDLNHLYYFDVDWRLVRVDIVTKKLENTNLKLDKYEKMPSNVERVNVSLKFLNETMVVICDGYETLYLATIGMSEDDTSKSVLCKYSLADANLRKSTIKDAIQIKANNEIQIILMNVIENEVTKKFETIINWLTFEYNDNNWTLKEKKMLNCFNTVPDYVGLCRPEGDGEFEDSLIVAGSSKIRFCNDDGSVIETVKENKNEKNAAAGDSEKKFLYEWNQTGQEVNVFVNLGEKSVDKNDLFVNINEKHIEVIYKNNTILKGTLTLPVVKNDSYWQISEKNEGIVELSLEKKELSTWSNLLDDGDKHGKYVLTEAQKESITHADDLQESNKKFFNINQLEECDGVLSENVQSEATGLGDADTGVTIDDDYLMLMRLNGKRKECVSQCYINNNKFLFKMNIHQDKPAALCLRYDVDGILWQPYNKIDTNDNKWLHHEHTFLAFGYVQASKQNCKYQLAPNNCSYVAICDTNKHLYVYKQNSHKVESTLRNRKSGQVVTHVSKQYVISLDTDKEIIGLHCSNEYIVVLLDDSIYFIQANVE